MPVFINSTLEKATFIRLVNSEQVTFKLYKQASGEHRLILGGQWDRMFRETESLASNLKNIATHLSLEYKEHV